MKVRISYTVDADEALRRAIASYYGSHGKLATRQDVRSHYEQNGTSMDDDIFHDYDQKVAADEQRAEQREEDD